MAQTAALLTTAKILREHYLPGLKEQFATATVLRSRLRKTKVEMVAGRYYIYNLYSTENQAVGARTETGTLPVASQQGYASALFYRANNYGQFTVTGVAIDAAARGGAGSLDLMDREMQGLYKTLRKDNNRQLFGDGGGLLCGCTAATDNTATWTIPVNTNPRFPAGTTYCRVGMPVAIQNLADGTIFTGSSATTITAVTSTSVTITDPGGTAANVTTAYGLFRRDASDGTWTSTAGSGTTSEQYGLLAAIGQTNPGWFLHTAALGVYGTGTSGLYGDINKATSAYWAGNVIHNGGTLGVRPSTNRALTIDLMQQAIDAAEFQDGNVSLIACDQAMWRKFAALMYPDRRWNDNIQTLDGGWKALMFAGIPVVKDIDCPPNTFFFLDESTFDILQERTLSEVDEGDAGFLQRTANKDEYTGSVVYREQLGCNAPNKNAILTDISPTL